MGHTTTEHFPEMNLPSGPITSSQTTEHRVPWGPLPSWRLSSQASECQAPREDGCQEEGEGEEAETEASVLFPSLYPTHKTLC